MWWVAAAVVVSLSQAAVSPPQAIEVASAKSSAGHLLQAHGSNLTVWCTSDNGIAKATLMHTQTKKAHNATISSDKRNASWTFANPSVLLAGDYKCKIETLQKANQEQTVVLYLRPVVHTPLSEKVEPEDSKKPFDVTMSDLIVVEGDAINISCPALAHPLPRFNFRKDAQPFKHSGSSQVSGSHIAITKAEYSDAGVYECEATNEYSISGTKTSPRLSISRKLIVKSPFGWIIPLVVILAILISLVLIIWACEMRKRKREKRAATYLEEN